MKQIISEKIYFLKLFFFLISQNQNCLHALFSSEIFSYIMGMQTHFFIIVRREFEIKSIEHVYPHIRDIKFYKIFFLNLIDNSEMYKAGSIL